MLPDSVGYPLRMEIAARRRDPELRLLPYLCSKNRSFLDIGANDGIYTYCARKHARRIYAVEPHPILAENLRRHFPTNVTVLELAFSDRQGSLPLYVPTVKGSRVLTRCSLDEGANVGFEQESLSVPVKRIDDMDFETLEVIKIDVEGHEFHTLKGGTERINRDRPCLIIEIEERHHPGRSLGVFSLLKELGFDGFFLLKGKLCPIDCFDFAIYQNQENLKNPTGKATGLYINNFIFVPHENEKTKSRLRQAGFLM